MLMRRILFMGAMLTAQLAFAGEVITTTISGMVCPMCAHNIEKSFKTQINDKTIKSFDVNLDEKTVTFELSDQGVITDEQIKTGINDAGYVVKGIQRTR